MDPSLSLSRRALLLKPKILADKLLLRRKNIVDSCTQIQYVNNGYASDAFCLFFEGDGGSLLQSFGSEKKIAGVIINSPFYQESEFKWVPLT